MGTFDILFLLIFWTYPEKISLVLFFSGSNSNAPGLYVTSLSVLVDVVTCSNMLPVLFDVGTCVYQTTLLRAPCDVTTCIL